MTISIDPTLAQLCELLDQALQSDDQRVKDALRTLLTVTVLCTDATAPNALVGPFKTLIDEIDTVKKNLERLEYQFHHITKSIQAHEDNWRGRSGPYATSASSQLSNNSLRYFKDKL